MSRSLQFSVFHNLSLASLFYTPAHSKNGNNVRQMLKVNAYINEVGFGGNEKSKAISLTAWGKGADILAICLTPGKMFTCFADLDVYEAPVYDNNQKVIGSTGQPLMRKAFGYTMRRFDLGNDSFKHIMDEIQRQVRGIYWWCKGHADYENFRTMLKGRMTLVGAFNPQTNAQSFGFAPVKLPAYQYGAYNTAIVANTNTMPGVELNTPVGTAANPAAVAAAFGNVQAAAPIAPVQPLVQPVIQPLVQPAAAPVNPAAFVAPAAPLNPANTFSMPQGV
jgi:hypothetical protein